MWPFNRFKKLKREDVINAMVELEKNETELMEGLVTKEEEINSLMEKGKKEKNKELKLLYAKKINQLKQEKEDDAKRAMYLMYNIQLMKKLKTSIDDNNFIVKTGKISLGNLLKDQRGLARFLNGALGRRIKAEEVLTQSDDMFEEVKNAYIENERIYKENKNDDELLAMFEQEDAMETELEITDTESESPRIAQSDEME